MASAQASKGSSDRTTPDSMAPPLQASIPALPQMQTQQELAVAKLAAQTSSKNYVAPPSEAGKLEQSAGYAYPDGA